MFRGVLMCVCVMFAYYDKRNFVREVDYGNVFMSSKIVEFLKIEDERLVF